MTPKLNTHAEVSFDSTKRARKKTKSEIINENNENNYIIHTSPSSTLIQSKDWQTVQNNPDKSIKSRREGHIFLIDSNSDQSGNIILNVASLCKITHLHVKLTNFMIMYTSYQ